MPQPAGSQVGCCRAAIPVRTWEGCGRVVAGQGAGCRVFHASGGQFFRTYDSLRSGPRGGQLIEVTPRLYRAPRKPREQGPIATPFLGYPSG
jgi:hypothetical protein